MQKYLLGFVGGIFFSVGVIFVVGVIEKEKEPDPIDVQATIDKVLEEKSQIYRTEVRY